MYELIPESMRPKFQLGQEVYPTDESKQKRRWFVVGMKMRPAYDLVSWSYTLARASYGDYAIASWASRCDVCVLNDVSEDQIIDPVLLLSLRKADLAKKIAEAESELARLRGVNADAGKVDDPTVCVWSADELHGHYDTGCGNGFFFAEDGLLKDSKFKSCMYCGKLIVEKPLEGSSEDE